MNAVIVFLLVAAVFTFIIVSLSIRIIRPFERGLVERLGKFQRILDPGLNMIMPFFDIVSKMDMREVVLDVPPQLVITKDNVNVEVDAIIYAQVTDPVRAKYEVANYIIAATRLAQTNLRNVFGELDLDACLTSRDEINRQLRDVLDTATDKWGIKVNRVEVQRIDPPVDIIEAMGRQMKAERDKRAAILEAEASRQAQITRAEGSRQAQILEAEGFAEAVKRKAEAEKYRQVTVAQGESEAILSVFGAIHDAQPDDKLITLKYLDVLPRLAEGQASKIFVPYEATGILSALSAIMETIRPGPNSPRATKAAGDEVRDV
ncbi:MAG TPA: SPFH domain-containing protein [Candidatus Deferrimicrobium sp.]|nr:SPFH domain-containing protein [Candidatus Deferrimicrobium sp.]